MASNQPNSMRVETNDRRINVCPRQENKLFKEDENPSNLIKEIKHELQGFANYLISCDIDSAQAHTTIENDAKCTLQATTQTAPQEVAEAILTGDLVYLIDHKPTHLDGYQYRTFDGNIVYINKRYHEILDQIILSEINNVPIILSHENLFIIFESLVGKMATTKIKLSKRLSHLGINLKPHKADGISIRGFKTTWSTPNGYLIPIQEPSYTLGATVDNLEESKSDYN